MADCRFSESDAILIGACITAATSIAVAQHLHAGGELEKEIAARAHKIYEAALIRFGVTEAAQLSPLPPMRPVWPAAPAAK
jgi:hypothetical protein